MAILGVLGWEMGALFAEPRPRAHTLTNTAAPLIVGNVSLEKTIVRTGTGSLKVSPVSGADGYYDGDSTGQTLSIGYIRFYVRITVLPTSLSRLLFGVSAGTSIVLNSNGTVTFWVNASPIGTSSIALTDTTKWYRIEIKNINNSQELLIDGISQVTSNVVTPNNISIRFGANDTIADTYTAYFDDFAMSDSGYIGAGQSRLLVPISDNARDTLWTGGIGGTSNLYLAVSKSPPSGTASETDTTQIEHAGGAAGTTDRYDANMTAYSSVGITSVSQINAVMPFVWVGEDSATGDKLLSFNIKTNPATTNTGSFNVAGTSGALGTFPTGWWTRTAPLGAAPSDLTSPIMTIIRPETATRVASCCFMGIYVDYSPPTTVPPQSKSDFIPAKSSQIVSVNRASFY